jgi:hypothetical protein
MINPWLGELLDLTVLPGGLTGMKVSKGNSQRKAFFLGL